MQLEVDTTTFYERLIFDSSLLDHRLFPGLPGLARTFRLPPPQVPSDDFCFQSLASLAKNVCTAICDEIAASVGREDVLIPLSGGMDSRLLLACARSVLNPQQIHCVTFGSSRNCLEYTIAHQVCTALGVTDHHFHELDAGAYLRCLPFLAQVAHGEVSAYHCHLLSYLLKETPNLPPYLLSGYFADAVAGTGQRQEEEGLVCLEESAIYARYLKRARLLGAPSEIQANIAVSLHEIWNSFRAHPGVIQSFYEYFYVTQRNRNLLLRLLDAYACVVPHVVAPFLKSQVAYPLLTAPAALRASKISLHKVIDIFAKPLAGIPVYSTAENRRTVRGALASAARRACTLVELVADTVFADALPTWNPWHTESHGRLLRNTFGRMAAESYEVLEACNVIAPQTRKALTAKQYMAWWHQAQFQAITAAQVLISLESI
jgi:hypothetical protein